MTLDLIQFAHDPKYNHRRRELPWYGLWNKALRIFEGAPDCYLFPQHPLWLIETDTDSDSEPPSPSTRIPGSDDDFVPTAYLFPPRSSLRWQLGRAGGDERWEESPSPLSSPLAHKSGPMPTSPFTMGHRVVGSQQRSAPQNARSISILEEEHKVTDFAVLQLRSDRHGHIVAAPIPVLAEIKLYRPVNGSDDDEETLHQREKLILKAQGQVEKQVLYLLAGRHQPAVIAIAASGPFWQWAQFSKRRQNVLHGDAENIDYVPKHEQIFDQRSLDPAWSKVYKIGTVDSDNALDNILEWVEEVFCTTPLTIDTAVRVLVD
ncbi:hypothetical protein BU15DRAFT_80291 [Melanogaster broomeanus]|nr:hypothetical protein BU15DRAFT_80291 [Melanogaster broomeanus]